ncbi:MAG: hypothetical protein MUD02_06390 [Bacteroidales bacterium]|jgi:hypothetical protein|nr:hypothetical protein [Bacteroidales bacterium]
MKPVDEKSLENFIRRNRDKFGDYSPPENHMDKFLYKFNRKFRRIVSIVPYLLRVTIATIVIFIASVIIWNNFIRKDRDYLSLKQKITLIFTRPGS